MADLAELIAKMRRTIIERERNQMPRPANELEAEMIRHCMWDGPGQFEILPPEDEESREQ